MYETIMFVILIVYLTERVLKALKIVRKILKD